MNARTIRRAQERKARKQAKVEANRANAEHSTGPVTPEGKARSSQNAFKHGLYSAKLVMPGEDPRELDELKLDLRAEHQPANTTEEILVNEMAEHFWRLRRMRKYEALALGGPDCEKWFGILPVILRVMASAERGFHKSLNTLRQLQKDRGFVPQKQATQEKPASASVEPVGFVSQNEEDDSDFSLGAGIATPEQMKAMGMSDALISAIHGSLDLPAAA